jgi:hypothetical protein
VAIRPLGSAARPGAEGVVASIGAAAGVSLAGGSPGTATVAMRRGAAVQSIAHALNPWGGLELNLPNGEEQLNYLVAVIFRHVPADRAVA